MTEWQAFVTILMCVIGTALTRFLPFVIFPENKETPKVVAYLGNVLPYAVIGMLVVYCLKDITFLHSPHGIPELLSCAVVAGLHIWKRSTLLSIGAGTLCYMILVQTIF